MAWISDTYLMIIFEGLKLMFYFFSRVKVKILVDCRKKHLKCADSLFPSVRLDVSLILPNIPYFIPQEINIINVFEI